MNGTFDYIKYDAYSENAQAAFKADFIKLEKKICDFFPDGRERQYALDALETSYMWIGKGLRNAQLTRNGTADEQPERTNS